jgi:tRNA threonylcarbamoyladenosine biosynthesis protein TsaB
MNVLGFDTATAATSACVLRADDESFEGVPDATRLVEPPGHARELMPAIAETMDAAGLSFGELDAIAPGIGPGSFTGLRVGVATARALAQAHGTEVRPVSSLAALAAGIVAPLRLPLIDARRGELFAALFDGDRERWKPFVATPETLAKRLRDASLTPLAAGDGSLRFRQVLEAAGARVAPDRSQAHVVRALHLCRLARDAPATPPEAVLPAYLRAPDVHDPAAKPTG